MSVSDSHTKYTWPLSWAQLEASPSWSPSSGAPPLAIEKAVALATRWIREKNPRFDDFKPTRITFQRTSRSENGHSFRRWYYTIDFEPVMNEEALYGGTYVAVVLFDGTVVEPRVEKVVR